MGRPHFQMAPMQTEQEKVHYRNTTPIVAYLPQLRNLNTTVFTKAVVHHGTTVAILDCGEKFVVHHFYIGTRLKTFTTYL